MDFLFVLQRHLPDCDWFGLNKFIVLLVNEGKTPDEYHQEPGIIIPPTQVSCNMGLI